MAMDLSVPGDVDPEAPKLADLTRAHEVLTESYRDYHDAHAAGVRGRRADYLPLNK